MRHKACVPCLALSGCRSLQIFCKRFDEQDIRSCIQASSMPQRLRKNDDLKLFFVPPL